MQGLAASRRDPSYRNLIEGRPGIMCADTDNPHSYGAWSPSSASAGAAFGYFGRYWTWLSSVCAEWPHADADRYMGPFDARTAHPVLVVGNQFDPATRYDGAVAVANLLPRSALLTVHGWGHSSHGWGEAPRGISKCADEISARYLIDLAVPTAGTVCEQDEVPFEGP